MATGGPDISIAMLGDRLASTPGPPSTIPDRGGGHS
jgi:hypothetical protein